MLLYARVCIPLSLLGNGPVKVSLLLLGNDSVKIPTSYAYYETILLSMCVHITVSFSMRSESYQRKVVD
jgi:hypothetical protein